VPVLFFHTTKTKCPECVVQGQVLDKVREKCRNFRIITVPNDLDIEAVNLIMEQYGVVTAPSLLINNEKLVWGIVSEDDIIGGFECY
jgi:Mg/Co/Ni transporter MgtE